MTFPTEHDLEMADTIHVQTMTAEEVDKEGIGLTDFEVGFIETVLRRLRNGIPLTAKQEAILEQIHEERC